MTNEKVSNTSKRLRELMTERGLRQRDIVAACAPYCERYHILLDKSYISLYVNGKVEPNQEKLYILSLALDVSEAWLMGFDVPRDRPPRQTVDYIVSDGDLDLIVEVKNLDHEQKDLLRSYLELLKRSKK